MPRAQRVQLIEQVTLRNARDTEEPEESSESSALPTTAFDRRADCNLRQLPANETLALELNARAAERRRGFFFFLPNKMTWVSSNKNEIMRPPSREPQAPGADFPELVFARDHIWTDAAYKRYKSAPERAKYLAAQALINPPQSSTVLWAIQCADHAKHPLHVTSPESLVVLIDTASSLYCATTNELSRPDVFGRRSGKARALSGPDPDKRINTAPFLWQGASTDDDQSRLDRLEQFSIASHDALYDKLMLYATTLPASLDGTELAHRLPRALSPEQGVALGTQLPVPETAPTSKKRQAASTLQKPRKRRQGEEATRP